MTICYHLIGLKLADGRTVRVFGQLTDDLFHAKVKELPPGWVVWHVPASELLTPVSDRVRDLQTVPLIYPPITEVLRAIADGVPAEKFNLCVS